MIVLWFIVGLFTIFAIARYNESSKLFWTLLLCFIMGFAGTKMVKQAISSGDEQNDEKLVQVCSTQVSIDGISTAMFYMPFDAKPMKVTDSNPVSQSLTSGIHEMYVILSEVFGRTRDQPLTLIKPPELWLQKDFLILHDTT